MAPGIMVPRVMAAGYGACTMSFRVFFRVGVKISVRGCYIKGLIAAVGDESVLNVWVA